MTRYPLLVGGVLIAVLFGLVESGLHLFVLGSQYPEWSPHDLEALWMHVPIILLLIAFSGYAQFVRSSRERGLALDAGRLPREIEKRHAVDAALLESERLFQQLVDLSPDMVWRTNADGVITYVSRAVKAISGFEPEEIVGMDALGLIGEAKSNASLAAELAARMRGEYGVEPMMFEFTYPRKDGSTYPAEVNVMPLVDANGMVTGLQGITRDISHRKMLEEALRRSETVHRSLVQSARDAIVTIDADSRVMFWNPAAETIFGYSADEMIGHSLLKIMPDDQRAKHVAGVQRLVATGISVTAGRLVERSGIRKDGLEIPIEYTLAHWETGDDIFFSAIVRDVTERKLLTEELLNARKLESMGVIAGGIAHDLNNYLTSVIGNISVARDEADALERDAAMKDAEDAANRIRGLTTQLLTFAKGGAPVLQASDLGSLLRESASFTLSGSSTQCHIEVAPDLWPAHCDEGQIGQVMQNLVLNADQATENGSTIVVRARNVVMAHGDHHHLKEGNYVHITVEDNGSGIAEGIKDKIFDPFFTTKHNGSGLGLATVYSIIRKSNGYIDFDSEEGVGTRFDFFLPASDERVSACGDTAASSPSIGSGNILVMDDDAQIRSMAARLLGKLGYAVTTCASGMEAIESCRKASDTMRPYDVVILDLTVPGGMGGQEAIREIRSICPQIKAIASSGYSEGHPVMSLFKEHGFDAIMPKPYNVQQISNLLRALIDPTEQSS